MSSGAIIGIVIAIIVVAAAAAMVYSGLRRARLRRQFGPEYERLTTELGSKRKAEAELTARQRRAAKLDIRDLSPEQQAQYAADWTSLQEQFVDTPADAVVAARTLVTRIMRDRGYPDGDENDTIVNLSVHNTSALDDYRQAQGINDRAGEASTEELREAMIRYRTLFDDLTDTSRRDQQASRGRSLTPTGTTQQKG
jgi:hypothetical protein